MQRIVVNLAPAHLRKTGSGFDLAIAIALLAAVGRLDAKPSTAWIGELSLDGRVRGVRGVLPAVATLRDAGIERVVVPDVNAVEAQLVEGITIEPVEHLRRAIGACDGSTEPLIVRGNARSAPSSPVDDLADVRGNEFAKRALEIAAAGAHNLLLTGSPGAGKTMLARRVPGILPALEEPEALEVTRVHSVAGLVPDGGGLVTKPPFRAPHHSVTVAGLVGGGGAAPIPGEVSLAHRGVLFLDELAEFSRGAIQALRQPMEEGEVTVARSRWCVTFPARCIIIAATNPCPCGWKDVRPEIACRCNPSQVVTYRGRLGGPVLDRVDLQVGVPPVTGTELLGDGDEEPSEVIAARVAAARIRQRIRWAPRGFRTNAELPARGIAAAAALSDAAQRIVANAVDDDGLTGRAAHRVIRVARTIADLVDADVVGRDAVREALTLRVGDLRA